MENITLAPMKVKGASKREAEAKALELLGRVGIPEQAYKYPSELSGGQQQRVAIARAIAGSPSVIFADEPTGNLDSKMAQGIMTLLQDINASGTTIIMVTHDNEQAQLAQRIVQIKDGVLSEESSILTQAIA